MRCCVQGCSEMFPKQPQVGKREVSLILNKIFSRFELTLALVAIFTIVFEKLLTHNLT